MASRSSLAELLHTLVDLAECVLGRLPLAALAALQCTCRAGRAAVAQLPEATWQVSHTAAARAKGQAQHETALLQAAAGQEYTAFHPLRNVPDVRQYLRQQYAARTCMFRGGVPARSVLHSSSLSNCLSPDFRKIATLAPDAQLQVLHAITGERLCQHQLPSTLPAATCPAAAWGWDPSSRYLVVPFGNAWRGTGRSRAQQPSELSGLAFLDTYTGACPFVQLDAEHGVSGVLAAQFCPDAGLVLVDHGRTHVPRPGRSSWTVHSCRGELVDSLAAQDLSSWGKPWAPAGQAVAFVNASRGLCLWTLGSGCTQTFSAVSLCSDAAWATPYSGSLLVYGPDMPSRMVSLSATGGSPVVGEAAVQLGCLFTYPRLRWGSLCVRPFHSMDGGFSCYTLDLLSLHTGCPSAMRAGCL